MISLVEKLHLNKTLGLSTVDSPLMASIKIKKLAKESNTPYFIARTEDNKYVYGQNTEGYKIGDKLDSGSLIIEIQKPGK